MLARVYLLNAALLTVHEIDAAYWHEWELFHLPGGVSGFLALHVALVLLVVWGYGRVLAGSRTGLWMSAMLAAAGILAVVVHGFSLLAGRPEFGTVASLCVLAAAGFLSLAQATLVAIEWRRVPRAQRPPEIDRSPPGA